MHSSRTLIVLFLVFIVLTVIAVPSLLIVSAEREPDGDRTKYENVELVYLSKNLQQYEGLNVRATGIALSEGFGSIYMFEDFRLLAQNDASAQIMVVTRSALLPIPPNSWFVEVLGQIQYSNLEGGFYFLNATSWSGLASPEPTATLLPTPQSSNEPTISPTPTSQSNNPGTTPSGNNSQDSSSSFLAQYGFLIVFVEAVVIVAAAAGYVFYKKRKK